MKFKLKAEGQKTRGGVNPKPTTPKPSTPPPAQKPTSKPVPSQKK